MQKSITSVYVIHYAYGKDHYSSFYLGWYRKLGVNKESNSSSVPVVEIATGYQEKSHICCHVTSLT